MPPMDRHMIHWFLHQNQRHAGAPLDSSDVLYSTGFRNTATVPLELCSV